MSMKPFGSVVLRSSRFVPSPQLQVYNQSIETELGLSFPVLRDADNAIASAFGLTLPQPPDVIAAEQFLGLDHPAHNGSTNWDLPMPARYVIDRQAKILYRAVHADHRTRTEPLACTDCMSADAD